MANNQQYDLICSLGANCSVSKQLMWRGLRKTALPFDWIWFDSEKAVYKLAEGFSNNFCNFLKKENLKKLEGEKYIKEHKDTYQYVDTYTNIYYYNHFFKKYNEQKSIEINVAKFHNRCKRLDYFLNNAERVLLIVSVNSEISNDAVNCLYNSIKTKYPKTQINIYFQQFNCRETTKYVNENLEIVKYERKENSYDYLQTNSEWSFLDDIELSEKFYKMNSNNPLLKILPHSTPPQHTHRGSSYIFHIGYFKQIKSKKEYLLIYFVKLIRFFTSSCIYSV